MKIEIESTTMTTSIGRESVRVWKGVTEGGVEVVVLVGMVIARSTDDNTQLVEELREVCVNDGNEWVDLRQVPHRLLEMRRVL